MNEKADAVIVGAGTAGLPAALFAAKNGGGKIVLIDAADKIGGALHLSMGTMSAAGTRLQAAKGIDDDPASHLADSLKISHGTARVDLLKLWQENAAATLHWLLDSGLSFPADQPAEALGHDAYSKPRLYTPKGYAKAYLAVLAALLEPVVKRGAVDLRLSTRMVDLVMEHGAVTGVVVEGPEGRATLETSTVLLATGGYGASDELWRELHDMPRRTHTYPWCRGDSFNIARQRGLAVDYWRNYIPTVGGTADPDNPEVYWIHTAIAPAVRAPWEIMVNLHGQRFMAEDIESPDFRERMLQAQPKLETWVIYDEAIRQTAPPLFPHWPQEKIDRAFAAHPDYQTADTLEDLAVRCDLDPQTLALTVERYNQGRAVGSDALRREHMPAAIERGPFYAIKHYSTAALTYGGVKTDDRLRVLNSAGEPVRGLYAAGEVLGMGAFGNCHLGGVTISSSLTFGRLLGPVLAGVAQTV
jgi:fumarate reductase flavoprotein subunit